MDIKDEKDEQREDLFKRSQGMNKPGLKRQNTGERLQTSNDSTIELG